MKKIAFALQVFTLLMMLPTCVFIEMNRSTAAVPEKSIVTKRSGNVKINPAGHLSPQNYKLKS